MAAYDFDAIRGIEDHDSVREHLTDRELGTACECSTPDCPSFDRSGQNRPVHCLYTGRCAECAVTAGLEAASEACAELKGSAWSACDVLLSVLDKDEALGVLVALVEAKWLRDRKASRRAIGGGK